VRLYYGSNIVIDNINLVMCKPYKGFDQRFYLTDYNVPTVLSIGRVYQTLILNVMDLYENVIEAIKKVYSSFISEEISNFNSNVYYSNPDYIKCSYEAGMLLD
jgi:tRNA G37 N-methylase TrmD